MSANWTIYCLTLLLPISIIRRMLKQIPKLDIGRILRIGSRIDFKSDQACWPWRGRRNHTTGYGEIKIDKCIYGAHRVIASLIHGPHPPWVEVVRHTCDNPICVNPKHLVYDTQSGNIKDAFRKKRAVSGFYHVKNYPRGSKNGHAKLREEDIIIIRQSTETQAVLASRYGVVPSRISMIRNRKSWTHV